MNLIYEVCKETMARYFYDELFIMFDYVGMMMEINSSWSEDLALYVL